MSSSLSFILNFVEQLGQILDSEVGFWLSLLEDRTGRERWLEFIQRPFNTEGVSILADGIASLLTERVRYACNEETYEEALKEGHALLKEIHHEATKHGIKTDSGLIDRPLSIVEVSEAAGFVKVKDGMVSLTERGEEAGRFVSEGRQSMSHCYPAGVALAIKIIKMPKGPAPEEIRREWVGMELAAERCHDSRRDFLTGGEVYCAGYSVPGDMALKALGEKSPEAAQWFYENFPGCERLVFRADEAEVTGNAVIVNVEVKR